MLKPEIHDPQGDAIASACRRLGFGQVAGVRQGKRFEIELSEPAAEERIAELAAGFRGTFKEVPGAGAEVVKPGPDGKAHPRLWAAFTLSGCGR